MLCKIADFGLSREITQDDEEDQAQYTTEVLESLRNQY